MPGSITPTLESLFRRALAFCASGQSESARRLFRAILAEAPWHVASASNLAALEAEAGEFGAALETMLGGLKSNPGVAYRFGAAAHAACNRQAWGKAQEFALIGLASSPDDGACWMALAECLVKGRSWDAAESRFRRALILDPGDAVAEHAFSLMLLALGRYEEGFHHHKAIRRLGFADLALPPDASYWEGEDLGRKSLFIAARLGLGDTIQYARYLPELRRRAGKLTVQVQPALVRLLQADPLGRDPGRFDYCTAFDELPGLLPSVPADPYVSLPAGAAAAWKERVRQGASMVVGLVHAGNPRQLKHAARSIDPDLLRPLLAMPKIRFVSFQVEGRLPPGIDALGPDFRDFFDTACALEHLDLLISVDTSVAHLAGAMGRADWILLPYDADWRWGLQGDRTIWYPNLRLFRQGPERDWRPVIAAVCTALL